MTVLFGYRHLDREVCPSCGGNYMMCEDLGYPDHYVVRCWCGGHGKVPKNDPDLERHLATPPRRSEVEDG